MISRISIISIGSVILSGCANYVPVETAKLKVPAECRRTHASDLPEVPTLTDKLVSADQVNRHWAKSHRLSSRPAYRRLYRDYRVCARYARGS